MNRLTDRTREDAEKALEGMTNSQKIRAMTDEELADWLKYERISVCPPDTGHIHCNISDICADKKCWLAWLKQEVTDGSQKDRPRDCRHARFACEVNECHGAGNWCPGPEAVTRTETYIKGGYKE